MEKFLSLPLEKQNTIIDAALSSFGAGGYRKTSVSDIAAAAGISKAMVFHYFGTKKSLYLYLFEVCGRTLINEFDKKFDRSVTDFFDKVMLAADIKISVMKKHPAILSFLLGAYFETDAEIKADLQAVFTSEEEEKFRQGLVLGGLDASRFKDGVDPKLVLKMLTGFAYGSINLSRLKTGADLDAVYQDFKDCVHMLKINLYKEEYL